MTKKKTDVSLERIIMRFKDSMGALVRGREFAWELTTLWSKWKRKERLKGTPAQQLASVPAKIEGIAEIEGLDNEAMAQKTEKKGRKILTQVRIS